MATKATLMKMFQEYRGYAQITNRRPTPRPIFLYLMQLRAHPTHIQMPKRHLTIAAEWRESGDTPLPITINHRKPGECSLPVVLI